MPAPTGLFKVVSQAFKAGRRTHVSREAARWFTHAQLKKLAIDKGISTEGTRAQLLARLFRSDEQLLEQAVRSGDARYIDDLMERREWAKAKYVTERDIRRAREQVATTRETDAFKQYATDRDIAYARNQAENIPDRVAREQRARLELLEEEEMIRQNQERIRGSRRAVAEGRASEIDDPLSKLKYEIALEETLDDISKQQAAIKSGRASFIDDVVAKNDYARGKKAARADELRRRANEILNQRNLEKNQRDRIEKALQDLADFERNSATPLRSMDIPELPRSNSRGGWLGDILKASGTTAINPIKSHPLAVLGGAGLLGGLGPLVVQGAMDQMGTLTGKDLREAFEQEYRRRQEAVYYQARMQRIQTATMENMARLAQYAPDLYNQALAGRSLPQGAAVFGGTKRPDLVEEIAYGMSLGAFQQEEQPNLDMYLR
jgi:hypothetical protein